MKVMSLVFIRWVAVTGLKLLQSKKSIDDLTDKLVEIPAQREITEGFAFLPDQPWQQEFEDAFPHEETGRPVTGYGGN